MLCGATNAINGAARAFKAGNCLSGKANVKQVLRLKEKTAECDGELLMDGINCWGMAEIEE